MTDTGQQTEPHCFDCGHPASYHDLVLTRGDGCIGRPHTPDMATLRQIRAGHHCGCPLAPHDTHTP